MRVCTRVAFPTTIIDASYGIDPNDDDGRAHAVVVNSFFKFYRADLGFAPVDRPGHVLIADDRGAKLMESNLSSFTTYVDVVLACWGTERMLSYKVSRYQEPKELHALRYRPTLDERVAEAEKD